MKKIFILPILIAPIAAMADDPVGPAHVNSGAVVATAGAPYATATEQTGDSTTVVSASYVKGAYNDAIAAVNKVNADKQGKLLNGSNNHTISSNVVAGSDVGGFVENVLVLGLDTASYNSAKSEIAQDMGVQNLDDALISAGMVLDGLQAVGQNKQNKITNFESGEGMSNDVISVENLSNASFTNINNYNTFRSNVVSQVGTQLDETFISADGVITLVKTAVDEVQSTNNSKRISAVTTWGNDTPTQLQLSTASN